MAQSYFNPKVMDSLVDPNQHRPTVVLLVGLNDSRRVHYANDYIKHHPGEVWRRYPENRERSEYTKRYNKLHPDTPITYPETYVEPHDGEIYASMRERIKSNIAQNQNIFIEAPNLTQAARKEWLDLFSDRYNKKAIVCLGYENHIEEINTEAVETRGIGIKPPYLRDRIYSDQRTLLEQMPSREEGYSTIRVIHPDGHLISSRVLRQFKSDRGIGQGRG